MAFYVDKLTGIMRASSNSRVKLNVWAFLHIFDRNALLAFVFTGILLSGGFFVTSIPYSKSKQISYWSSALSSVSKVSKMILKLDISPQVRPYMTHCEFNNDFF